MGCTSLTLTSPVMVDAQIHRWTITDDDIYLLKFGEAPPQWLEDMIENIMVDTGLVEDVGDLTSRFDNFEEGYTEHFYDWTVGDTNTLAYVETIYTTNATFNAGLQDIKVAYVSKNESGAYFDSLIGAWQTGAGGAWFNERVSVVSNVAYSAARSASTLTASLSSQQDQLNAIVGDIETLESQVDGKVETHTGYHPVVEEDGTLIPTADPYAIWVANGEVAIHTGDTYIYLEEDPATGNDNILGTWNFVYDSETSEYIWLLRTDDIATKAYEAALEAGALADGKINTYYQTYPPTIIEDPSLGDGDLWLDSDDNNKMYRYDGTEPFTVDGWIDVKDVDIQASVDRLDEATVTIDGKARAKSSLIVDADGVTSGYVAEADNTSWGTFQIFADKFYVSGEQGSAFSQAPFSIDTEENKIKFNGLVEFTNTTGTEDVVLESTFNDTVNKDSTIIDGGRIDTYTLNADRIKAQTIWVDGMIASPEFQGNVYGIVSSITDPPGFLLNAAIGEGTYTQPNIYGCYIRGGTIAASVVKFGGARMESECSTSTVSYTGKSGYTESQNSIIPSASGGIYYTNILGIVGPCSLPEGYDRSRILSLTDTTCLLTVTGFSFVNSGQSTTYIQKQTSSNPTWATISHVVTSGEGGDYPGLSISVDLSTAMSTGDTISFRAVRSYNGEHGGGNLNISVQINN